MILNNFRRKNDLRKVILILNNKNPDTDEANAYVLVSNIDLPNIFIVSIELEGFSPAISIKEDVMNKVQNYSRTIFNSEIYVECNNQKVNYTLKASILYKTNNHFIAYEKLKKMKILY